MRRCLKKFGKKEFRFGSSDLTRKLSQWVTFFSDCCSFFFPCQTVSFAEKTILVYCPSPKLQMGGGGGRENSFFYLFAWEELLKYDLASKKEGERERERNATHQFSCPTSNGGMQNGRSVGICTHIACNFLHAWHRFACSVGAH